SRTPRPVRPFVDGVVGRRRAGNAGRDARGAGVGESVVAPPSRAARPAHRGRAAERSTDWRRGDLARIALRVGTAHRTVCAVSLLFWASLRFGPVGAASVSFV